MTTLIVGIGQDYATLKAAVAAAHTGDTIDVQAGTYVNDFPALINGLTIQGVGGIAKFVATAQPGNGKAIFDVAGNTTLANLDISGVTVPDANGAGVRYEGGNLVIQNTAIHGNQDGILGASDPTGTITITGSEIYGNGTGTGSTHNIYIGDIATFTLTNSYVHDANTGHEIKSRAENNIITNNRIEDNGSTASYEIDLPNGGNATITGNTIQKSASSGNHVSIAYGEEYVANSSVPEQKLNSGTSVTVANNFFVSDQSGADVVWDATGGLATGAAHFTVANNSVYGYSQIDKAGHLSSTGFTTITTRPALDTSSPINSGNASTPTPPPTTTPPADTTAPSLSVSESVFGVSKSNSDHITGSVADSGSGVAKVEVYDTTGGRTVDLGSATLTAGSFAFTAANLADGSHAFSAIAIDKAGNATQPVSAGAALIVDTTAPSLTAGASVFGTTTQTSNLLTGTVSDSGSGVAQVEIYDTTGGRTVDLGRATLNGSAWNYTASNLALGTHAFSAVATDKAGNATASVSTGTSETIVTPTSTSTSTPTPPAPPTPITPAPTGLQSVSQVNGGLQFNGTAPAGTTGIVLNDTVNGQSQFVGAALVHSDGTWSITAATINPHAVNTLTALMASSTGFGVTGPALILSSAASETLSGTAGQADLFAFLPGFGQDVVRGFESTTATNGGPHDVIDLAGSAYQSFQQLQSHITGAGSAVIRVDSANSITLSGVNASTLQASDFRFS